MTGFINEINIKGACFIDEPLSRHTTFDIGGKVKLWIEPQDEEDLASAMRQIKLNGLSWRVIGNGSNILAGVHNLSDAVIRMNNFKRLDLENNTIIAECGVSLAKLVGFSAENAISGVEFLTGIPGVVGGAIKGNAGAQGRSISDVLKEIYIMDEDGNTNTITRDEISFGCRRSGIREDFVILRGIFRLGAGDPDKICGIMENYLRLRNKIFPKEANAGCIFKNPPDISAGRIIDGLGLKGFTIGRAMVSQEHANVIVNLGDATYNDTHSLIEYVRAEVYRRTGTNLELEIDVWGA